MLLVEDNPHEARLLREHLISAAANVALDEADRLATGIARMEAGDIDVVLLDLKLPDSSGLATLDRMQAAAPHVPIIVLTGTTDEDLAVALVRRGAQDYIVKGTLEGREIMRAVQYAYARSEVEHARLEIAEKAREMARLTEMTEFKMRIVNTAAHELRTPMTPIRIQMHLLGKAMRAGDAVQARKAWDVLSRNFERLGHLVDEVVDVAKLEAARLKFQRRPVDLNDVVSEAVDAFEAHARETGVALHWTAGHPLVVEGDANRLYQVMANLLGNALKFTPEGGHVEVETLHAEGVALVRVRDSGIGIARADLGRLFQPFSQVHDVAGMNSGGTGLGLYICRGIMEGHGGSISAESDGEGRGTMFEVRLPMVAG